MKDRIRQLMESQHLTQTSFADMLCISPASLSSIFNDRTKPTLNHVEAIHMCFPRVNLSWLLYGDGDMFVSDDPKSGDQNGAANEPSLFGSDAFQGNTGAPQRSASPAPSVVGASQMQMQQYGQQSMPAEIQAVKIVDKPQRKITEIRIFYDDQTWETFVPKK